MDISIDKSEFKSLVNKLDKLSDNLINYTETGIQVALKDSKKYALECKSGSKNQNLILTELTKKANERIGKIYTNFSYAPFLEYGTGRKAEMPHIGKTRTFRISGFYFWYAPADKVIKQYKDDDFFEFNGEMYPMNAYMNNNKYVMVFEQESRPFMRPTAFYRHDLNLEKIKKSIKHGIRREMYDKF